MAEERVERRLAAILAADVAGYSRLMGTDEEGTHQNLKAHWHKLVEPKIALHRGRIIKNTGDGFLAEFMSVLDAVRCAAEIQQGMVERNTDVSHDKRIEFRMGIHQGDIIIDSGDIFGDGVNLAARLEGLAQPGGICLSARVQEDVRGKLDLAFEDIGEQKLKNIERPVRVYRILFDHKGARSGPALALPDRPSIAMLPFSNLSGDADQDYFADGVVEEIITALSRFRQLFVIARNSSFTYKGRAVDVKQVGRELGVRYVLEGSVRRAANRVRITAQLIDAQTGAHLWADRFDGTPDDIFDLQDQVTSGVVGVIAPKIEQAEIERAKRKPTGSLDAYDYYLHGLASLYQDTKEGNDEALRLFGKAIELDPNFAAAYGMSALCYVSRQWKHWMLEPQKEVSETARLVNRAAELGRDDAMALSAAGMAAGLVVRDLDRAVVLLDRSLLLNPNLAISWVRSAWVRIFLGEFDLAIEHASRAMRLSPLDPFLVGMQSAIAFAYFCAGRYDQSAAWAEKAVKEQPTFAAALRVLAASSASLGRMKEATEALVRLKETKAPVHISELWHYPFREPKYSAKYVEALRKAGFPE
jgi:TolB-like protein/class 3 adenylate cyclase